MNYGIVQRFKSQLEASNFSDFHGLISPGLTCYLNSVLQVLFMTEEFRHRIKRYRCSQDITPVDTHLKDLFTALETNKAKTHDITQILGIDNVYEQRDAAEYFEKILRLTSPQASEIFKGKLNHVTECGKCQNRSDAEGFFWILPLSISDPNQIYRVDRGLEDFFEKEEVNGENKMFCAQCNKKQEAHIMCEMTQPPDVLTLLLKRFHYDYKLRRNVKINCEAEVPLTLQKKDCTYDLYAMVKHYGDLSGGHYIAHIYSVQTKEWYCFDDARVKLKKNYLVSGKECLRSHSVYLLMYMKRRMEERCSKEDEAQEDFYKMSTEKVKETDKDIIRYPSSNLQGKVNGLISSADHIKFQEIFLNNQLSPKKSGNKVRRSRSQKSVFSSDNRMDKHSPKIKRSSSLTVSQSKSNTNIKPPVWK